MSGMIMWSPGVSLDEIEKQVILKAFSFYRQNKTTTSQALGISIRTLDTKLEKYEHDERERLRAEDERRRLDNDFLHRQRGPSQSLNSSQEERDRQRASVLPSSHAGVRVEPSSDAPAQHPVPLPEPKKVQTLLHEQTAGSGARKAR